ncbi:MAG: outer membrane protein [Vitreimonas sp.]
MGRLRRRLTGFYAGGSLGHASGESEASVALGGQWSIETQALRDGVTDFWSATLEPEGWSYGVQAGYNREFASAFTIGGEIGYAIFDADDGRLTGQEVATSTAPALTYQVGNSVEIDSVLAARANIGYDFEPVLAYVTLGYSWADVSVGAETLSNGGYSKIGGASDTVGGFTYGLGAAMRLGGPWSARLEYTHTEFDDVGFETVYRPGSTFPGYVETFSQDLTLDVVSAGVNFHF